MQISLAAEATERSARSMTLAALSTIMWTDSLMPVGPSQSNSACLSG
jgi:hypothetical protein